MTLWCLRPLPATGRPDDYRGDSLRCLCGSPRCRDYGHSLIRAGLRDGDEIRRVEGDAA